MAKRYGYRPDEVSQRDQIYANEIAAQRPAFATKVDCGGDYDERNPAHSVRGVPVPEPPEYMTAMDPNQEDTESAVDRFNRQLRGQPLRGERE